MAAVSVVIPAFNSAEYIGAAIQSVLDQTVLPAEIIVVDDGSTDTTAAAVQKYPVKYLYQANAGPSSARNTGILNSTGDFVAFLDTDDLWLPDKLAVQIEAFQKYPVAGMSFSTVWNLYDGNNPKIAQTPYYPPQLARWLRRTPAQGEVAYGSVYELLLHKNCVATSSVVVRRSVIDRVGLFDARLRGCEDYDYWIRLARLSPAIFVKKPISRYRVVDAGLSGAWQTRYDRFYSTAVYVIESHMHDFPSRVVRRALGASLADYGFYCLSVGRAADALALSRRSLKTYATAKGVKVFFESSMPRFYSLMASVAHLGRGVPK